eukprot:CAMPEP_0172565884 /NCGR_PEP_ID=MMETSP1067-20121228/109902_1 /TAXON_ID=265564 ORGANISM="Thalassiosira punctigera, Strain Tpunct2005C2" /NCGR_SAMPLE_ID=MMETSP1067 /ASSEMBLY_ACC=CAM_ASM_000444 /LENGTH=34 /DNA_ID= /DNA_START= /DNA_END= /DNA_ORIENTATION=
MSMLVNAECWDEPMSRMGGAECLGEPMSRGMAEA